MPFVYSSSSRGALVQARLFLRRRIGERGMLTELERADIGHNRPAVARPDAVAMRVHCAIAIGDGVEIMPVIGCAKLLVMETCWLWKATLHHDAASGAGAVMAG